MPIHPLLRVRSKAVAVIRSPNALITSSGDQTGLRCWYWEHHVSIRRHVYKMKLRTRFFMAIGLIILLSLWFRFSTRTQDAAQVFPATVNRDCAPWDGAAFTVSIRYDAVTTVMISIWQAPDLAFPVTFSFPDETMRIGTAYSVKELDPWEELSGKVWFERISPQKPVTGRFNLTSEGGAHFEGGFVAEWGNEAVYCG